MRGRKFALYTIPEANEQDESNFVDPTNPSKAVLAIEKAVSRAKTDFKKRLSSYKAGKSRAPRTRKSVHTDPSDRKERAGMLDVLLILLVAGIITFIYTFCFEDALGRNTSQ
ncbi:uncharacterized protein NEMAJ01_1721 [Nematocida major]|uniref:uncharacterized protein n=1 Tax=Nematocida major TaxID=1912982 RepID=UPI002007F165|nr:uncharacterized protein NEMAJ01_1721 [Nematocida major]KAH9386825.1 hypothetical protein NEMAJ01_1721 [Nematocida major]